MYFNRLDLLHALLQSKYVLATADRHAAVTILDMLNEQVYVILDHKTSHKGKFFKILIPESEGAKKSKY